MTRRKQRRLRVKRNREWRSVKRKMWNVEFDPTMWPAIGRAVSRVTKAQWASRTPVYSVEGDL